MRFRRNLPRHARSSASSASQRAYGEKGPPGSDLGSKAANCSRALVMWSRCATAEPAESLVSLCVCVSRSSVAVISCLAPTPIPRAGVLSLMLLASALTDWAPPPRRIPTRDNLGRISGESRQISGISPRAAGAAPPAGPPRRPVRRAPAPSPRAVAQAARRRAGDCDLAGPHSRIGGASWRAPAWGEEGRARHKNARHTGPGEKVQKETLVGASSANLGESRPNLGCGRRVSATVGQSHRISPNLAKSRRISPSLAEPRRVSQISQNLAKSRNLARTSAENAAPREGSSLSAARPACSRLELGSGPG